MMSIPITPETKIGALLDAYPALEDVLIVQAPVFKNLKNPVLRKTVAKVATIEKAARIGGVSPKELVRVLREAAGIPSEPTPGGDAARDDDAVDSNGNADEAEPPWVAASTVRETVDADAVLAAGETPLPGILRHAAALQPGDAFRIVSSFRPVPVVDALRKKGFKTYTRRLDAERFETFAGLEAI